MPSCMRAPPPEPLMMISGSPSRVARSTSRVSRSPTTEPMLPMMNAESVTPKATRRARIMPVPVSAASRMPVRALLGLEPLGVGLLVAEARADRWATGRRPTLRTCPRRAPQRHAHRRAEVHVVPALRADVHQLLGFLAEDRLAAVLAAEPQAAGHAALFARRLRLRRWCSDSLVAMAR